MSETAQSGAARGSGTQSDIRRILVVKPSSFGDILHLFPALARLKSACPNAELDFLVHPDFAALLAYSPFPVRRIIYFKRRELGNIKSFIPEFADLWKELRKEKYDLTIDYQGLFRSAFFARCTRSKRIIGFSNPRERAARWFYTVKIPVHRVHAVERNVMLTDRIFPSSAPLTMPELPAHLEFVLPEELPEKFVVLLPGTRWSSKKFPPKLFGEVVKLLHNQFPQLGFIAAGGASERGLAAAIAPEVCDWAGKTTLPQLMELLRRASAVIGNDSGPLHAAAMLNRPVFGFYGPTDPVLTGPWGEKSRFFQGNAPCLNCLQRVCPHHCECHQLDSGEIANAVAQVLSQEEC